MSSGYKTARTGYWYDYGARFYDPQLARFHTIDPLSEMFSHQTTYAYADNNPIRFIDYMGMNAQDSNKDDEDEDEKKKNQRPEYTISLYGNKNVGDAKAKFGSPGTAENVGSGGDGWKLLSKN